MKSNKGITLIALVMTIVIMIILVGVSVTAVINSQVINSAKNASKQFKIATIDETNFSIDITPIYQVDYSEWAEEVGLVGSAYAAKVNPPKLTNGMIPVVWNGTSWVKADTNTLWYSYGVTSETKNWANAVTVKSNTRGTYTSAAAGTPIAEADIVGMFVWIPRFSYKIVKGYHSANSGDSEENSAIVAIQFIEGTGNGESNIAYNSTNTSTWTKFPNGFVVHPAFKSTVQIEGFWVAKFEASSSTTTNSTSNLTNYGKTGDPAIGGNEVTVRPNVTSWRYLLITDAQTACQNMKADSNIHGFTSSVDTHLMKETEWGAVAYLTQSLYGNPQTSETTGVWSNCYISNSSKAAVRTGMVGSNGRDASNKQSATDSDIRKSNI